MPDRYLEGTGNCAERASSFGPDSAFSEMGLAFVRQNQSKPDSTVRWAWTQVLATPR